jgi:hypothetical protein
MGGPSSVALTSQLLISQNPFALLLFKQGTSLSFARSILTDLVNLSFNDLVVEIVHPVVVGSVTIMPLGVMLALVLVLLIIGGSMAFVFITVVSIVIVPGLLVILFTIVSFTPGVAVPMAPLPAVMIAGGLS